MWAHARVSLSATENEYMQQVPLMTTFLLVQELIHGDGLRTALAGWDDVLLEPVLQLLLKHIADPQFGEITCDIGKILIGIILLSLNTLISN